MRQLLLGLEQAIRLQSPEGAAKAVALRAGVLECCDVNVRAKASVLRAGMLECCDVKVRACENSRAACRYAKML